MVTKGTILVTGANGFVARHTCDALQAAGYTVRGTVRTPDPTLNIETVIVPSIDSNTDWFAALKGADAVVHLAARVHVFDETANDPLEAFREVNTRGTLKLARAANLSGVERIVFLSSIGVHGDVDGGTALTEASAIAPYNPYTQSKWEAEQKLTDWNIQADNEEPYLDLVIVRAPLVYGKNAPGNFSRLAKLVNTGLPLPFGSVDNRRSFISVQNLADALVTMVEHPHAANETFLVSDGDSVSTTTLLKKIAQANDNRALLIPFPTNILKTMLGIVGKGDLANKLLDSLAIDMSKAQHMLGWQPPYTLDEGLQHTFGTDT